MKGKKVPRGFGWDCHGLPIESLVQNELGLAGVAEIQKLGVDKFNETCRGKVLKYTSEWKKTVRRMGRWVDFDTGYKTMDKNFMESVWWVFKQCFDKGLIYQGYRIQPYSPALATPLSNFETNQGYKDRQDPSLTLIFPINSDEAKFKDTSILVWTTTPWTLYSNFCIVVGPDMDYNLVEQDGKKYWIAASRTAAYFKNPNIVDTCKGADLVGKDYEPLSRISDEYVTPDQLSRHYKIGIMGGGSVPLVRTSLLSTPTAGLKRRPATPCLPHPPAQMLANSPFFCIILAFFAYKRCVLGLYKLFLKSKRV